MGVAEGPFSCVVTVIEGHGWSFLIILRIGLVLPGSCKVYKRLSSSADVVEVRHYWMRFEFLSE